MPQLAPSSLPPGPTMAGPLLVWESGATLSVHGLTVPETYCTAVNAIFIRTRIRTSVLCVRDWEHDGAKLRILWTSCSEIIIVYLLSPAWKLNQAYSGKSPLNSRTRPAKAEDQQQTTSL